ELRRRSDRIESDSVEAVANQALKLIVGGFSLGRDESAATRAEAEARKTRTQVTQMTVDCLLERTAGQRSEWSAGLRARYPVEGPRRERKTPGVGGKGAR